MFSDYMRGYSECVVLCVVSRIHCGRMWVRKLIQIAKK